MEIGVGSAISKTYGFISVARYSPKGGVGGPQAFKKNVFSKGILVQEDLYQIGQEANFRTPSYTIHSDEELALQTSIFKSNYQISR